MRREGAWRCHAVEPGRPHAMTRAMWREMRAVLDGCKRHRAALLSARGRRCLLRGRRHLQYTSSASEASLRGFTNEVWAALRR